MSTLTFDPEKHQYRLDGKRLTSVTTVLGAGIPKPQLVDWAARTAAQFAVDNPGASYEAIASAHRNERDKAAVRGTNVHNLAEDLVHGRAVEVPEELAPYIDGYLAFLDLWQITPILTEKTVYIAGQNLAGRFDLIGTSPFLNEGLPVMIDLKTSNGVYRETKAQCAAYSKAAYYVTDEDPGTQHVFPDIQATYVAHVTPEGTDLICLAQNKGEIEMHYTVFQSAYDIYRFGLAAHKVREPLTHPSMASAAA
jgi:hypothetical protein